MGLPLALAFAEEGHTVAGVDSDSRRAAALAAGESYIEDVSSERLAAVSDRLSAGTRYAELADCDAVMIAVPTPLTTNREPDLGPMISAGTALAGVLRAGQLVVLESTTYPGTTRERLAPLLEESGLAAGTDFNLAFSPERIDPGRTDYTMRNTPKIVGGLTPECLDRAVAVYSEVCDHIVPVSGPEPAELSKLLENVFRSVNIALVNELAMLCERMGIDVWEVVDAAATKPYGFMRFDPGPGMGGHCLPVDPFYLAWKAREYGQPTEFVELAGEVNQRMPEFCVGLVAAALNDHSKSHSRLADRDPGRVLQAGRRRPSRVARAEDHEDAGRPRRRAGLPRRLRVHAAGLRARQRAAGRGARGRRLRGHRDRPPRARRGGRGGGRAVGRGPARRHPGHRIAPRGAPLSDGLVRVGVVGLGYWGPNLARNFDRLPGVELTWLCDAEADRRERLAESFPGARLAGDLAEMLADPELDAVAVATPVPTHAAVAEQVLAAGKHCFVEKPLAQTVADAERTVAAAAESGRTLMVGHLLEYHPGLEMLNRLATDGELGDIHYIYGNRLNLGKLRAEENALWSLGAHDVSVLLRLAGEEPYEVSAKGESYMRPGVEDVVFCFMRFPSGLAAHLHLSWLDPHKERRFTVVGSKKMATFDDMALDRKLTIYDKGFDQDSTSYGEYITRSGDTYSPRVPNDEPLRIECAHFAECVRDGTAPRSDGASGLRVVKVLEALQQSLDESRRAQPV